MKRRQSDRHASTTLWLILVFAVALGAAGLTSLFIASRLDLRGRDVDVASLRDQVIELGGVPAVPAPGADGEAGHDGRDGKDGRDGDDGRDGRDGLTVVGPPGADGVNGVDGRDGRDGLSVIGPQGAQGESITGPSGPVGPEGPAGPQGPAGTGVRSFWFIAGGVRYTCTDPDGDGDFGECPQQAVVP